MLPFTQKEDGIQEKPRNPLYSDILKRKKSNTTLTRKTSQSNTSKHTKYSRTTPNFKHKQQGKITSRINFIHKPKSRRITETANKTTPTGKERPKRQLQIKMKQTITHHLKNLSSNQHIQKTQRWPPTTSETNNKIWK